MSTNFTTVPVIDISGLFGNSEQKQAVVENLSHAAKHVGFMYITGHGMKPDLFADMLHEAKAFFALPIEEKMKFYIGKSSNHRGYVPQGEEVLPGSKDLKEAFDLSLDLPPDDPDYIAGNPLIGPNQWPDSSQFKNAITQYYNAVFDVGRHLISAFAVALGLKADAFEASLTRPPSQLRLIHYPYDPTAHDVAGIGAHTDFECFTLLRATAPGLEVMNGQGEWIDAPPIENAFIVNIGDMLELLSGGEFVATSHRVRKVKEERYSFPLFFSLDYNTRVQPLPGRENPALPAQSLVAGEHLFAQTAQVFTYLKQRIANGTVLPPSASLEFSSFGQEARHKKT